MLRGQEEFMIRDNWKGMNREGCSRGVSCLLVQCQHMLRGQGQLMVGMDQQGWRQELSRSGGAEMKADLRACASTCTVYKESP